MVVAVLVLVALVAVLVPPAVRAHQLRRAAFVGSFGRVDGSDRPPAPARRSPRVERRRAVLARLLIGLAGTGLLGLLPGFHALLVVHLFLVDGFLGYVAVLAHEGDTRAGRAPRAVDARAAVVVPPHAGRAGAPTELGSGRVRARLGAPARRRAPAPPAVPADLPPVAAAG